MNKIVVNSKDVSECPFVKLVVNDNRAEVLCSTDDKPCSNYPKCIHKAEVSHELS